MNRFITFSDTSLFKARERIRRQAESLEFFDEIRTYTERDLSPDFTHRMGRLLSPFCQGFGYWCWKPWIILHSLEDMEEGDRLLYLDVGCHINPYGKKRFLEYVNMLDKDPFGLVVFGNGCTECHWTKGDVFHHFSIDIHDEKFTQTQQIAGGYLFIRKNPAVESMLREWMNVFYHHLNLVDDTPSLSPDLPGFRNNRQDQSILSILCKMRGVQPLPLSEVQPADGDWEKMTEFPIQDRRDLKSARHFLLHVIRKLRTARRDLIKRISS